MNEIPPEQKKKIVAALDARGARLPCPRCGHTNFTLLDGYFNQYVRAELDGSLVLGGPSVPTAVIVCTNCGYLSQHALGALGLLQEPKTEEASK